MKFTKKILTSLTVFLISIVVLHCNHRVSSNPPTQKTPELIVVENFYKSYFDKLEAASQEHPFDEPIIPLSKSFKDLVNLDEQICKKNAGTDICGWGADGLIFLNAQEYDPNLTFENSKFSITEPRPYRVVVRFNVYPSIKDAGNYYDRTFEFLMVKENDQWVVDDMISDGHSQREWIKGEIEDFNDFIPIEAALLDKNYVYFPGESKTASGTRRDLEKKADPISYDITYWTKSTSIQQIKFSTLWCPTDPYNKISKSDFVSQAIAEFKSIYSIITGEKPSKDMLEELRKNESKNKVFSTKKFSKIRTNTGTTEAYCDSHPGGQSIVVDFFP